MEAARVAEQLSKAAQLSDVQRAILEAERELELQQREAELEQRTRYQTEQPAKKPSVSPIRADDPARIKEQAALSMAAKIKKIKEDVNQQVWGSAARPSSSVASTRDHSSLPTGDAAQEVADRVAQIKLEAQKQAWLAVQGKNTDTQSKIN